MILQQRGSDKLMSRSDIFVSLRPDADPIHRASRDEFNDTEKMRKLLSECTGEDVSEVIGCIGNMTRQYVLYDDSVTDETLLGIDGFKDLLNWSLRNTDPLRYVEAVYQVGDFRIEVAKHYGANMHLALQVAACSNFDYDEDKKQFRCHYLVDQLRHSRTQRVQLFPLQRAALGGAGM